MRPQERSRLNEAVCQAFSASGPESFRRVIDRGKIRKRKKGASRKFRGAYGHTPLSAAEDIPWRCRRLVIGTGAAGALPVMNEVHEQARRREVDLVILPTAQAITVLAKTTKDTNAILHLTC